MATATKTAEGLTDGATKDTAGQLASAPDSALGGLGGRGKTTEDKGTIQTPEGEKPSSLKIHIKLDLDVEIHLSARIKGDITIGLL
ncbi:hypothetical protein LTR09_005091 [Extremus antarcticus]|uniref:Uncharacterized protein n=1 Tax=Extremus antarcticus TaxID=702011 RepID=A0AAJ0DH28_9PEZI|nr:hypothetical protein LTR09_005091 [Extremus antarcticus]